MEFIFIFISIIIAVVFFFIFSVVLIIYFISKNNSPKSNNTYRRETEKGPPPKQHKKEGIQTKRFDACKNGLHTAGRERAMLDTAEADAAKWIDDNPEVEIINITSTIGGMNASVTVWYKLKESESRSPKPEPKDPISKYGPKNDSTES